MKNVDVTIEVPVDGKANHKHSYVKAVAESVADVQALSKAQVAGLPEDQRAKAAGEYLVKAWNYGNDLLLRAAERSKASRAAQGPDKDIKKAVDLLVASGFDAAAARELIINQRTAKGLPV